MYITHTFLLLIVSLRDVLFVFPAWSVLARYMEGVVLFYRNNNSERGIIIIRPRFGVTVYLGGRKTQHHQ